MVNQQRVNVWYVPKGKDPLNKREDIITAAEKYIQEHGTGELQYMLDNVRMKFVLLWTSPLNSQSLFLMFYLYRPKCTGEIVAVIMVMQMTMDIETNATRIQLATSD